MTEPDPEFEEFLRKRRPLFRELDDGIEPPAELDRIVLRHARQAIEPEPEMRVYRSPRWAAPVAIAATLVVGLAFVLQFGPPARPTVQPEVTVENIAQRVEVPPAPPAAADTPEWRRDARSWMAEIERLRASGDLARANAEQAEFNRQHRAYAASPDR
jgi:hypothetical protein